MRCTTSIARPSSVAVVFKKRRRAGTLWKSSRTSTLVPTGPPASRGSVITELSHSMRQPVDSSRSLVRIEQRAIAPIDASASPRKPSEPM